MHAPAPPDARPSRSSIVVPSLVGAIALGAIGALAAASFGALPAVVSGVVAAAIGAAGALTFASDRRWLGGGILALGLGATACCGMSGLAYQGVRSLVPDSVALEHVTAGERAWRRHPTLGFLVGDPGAEWVEETDTTTIGVFAVTTRVLGASEGVWMWRHPELGTAVIAIAVQPTETPRAEIARAFLEGMVSGGLRGGGTREPSLERWDDERREVWARATGLHSSGPLGVSARYHAWPDAEGAWHVLITIVMAHPDDDMTPYLLESHAPGERWRGPGVAPPAFGSGERETLVQARAGLRTELIRAASEIEAVPASPEDDDALELVQYESPAGSLWAYRSRNAGQPARGQARRPGVLWLHGGFSIDEGPEDAVWDLAERGVVVMAPTLRGEPGNPGAIELFLGEVDDARAALEHLRSLPTVDPARVVVMGHSSGGTLAVLLAETGAPARAFVAFGPMDDVVWLALEGPDGAGPLYDVRRPEESWARSPVGFVGDIEAPTFVVEGETGNAAAARALRDAARPGSPLRVMIGAGADHWQLVAPVMALLTPRLFEEGPLVLGDEEVAAIAAGLGGARSEE